MRRPSLALSAVALAAVVTGAIAAPAAADGGITVTVHVQDASGEPLGEVDVSFLNDADDYVSLGSTGASGTVQGSGDEFGELYEGDGTLLASDFDEARFDARSQYADAEQDVTITEEGPKEFTVTMYPGSRIEGTVAAPSGRPVQGIPTFAQLKDEDGGYDFTGNLSRTTSKGAFTLAGLGPGSYRVTAGVQVDQFGTFGSDTKLGDIVVEDYGQTRSGFKVRNWRVQCDTGFSVSSPKKGQAKLSIKATAKAEGLTNPKGTIVVKRGSKTVKTIPWKSSKATTTLTRQPAGKKVTYTATYSGGDCLAWKSSKKVTIKKR